jgi:flagellar protein FliO/FliZ
LAALFFVISLIFLIAFIFRKFNLEALLTHKLAANKRIVIEEVVNIDSKRKLVLIRRDEISHLLLLGNNNEIVIESNIGISKSGAN